MKTKHKFEVRGKCPVDDATDLYAVTVTTSGMIEVEKILETTEWLLSKPVFQEHFTRQLSKKIGAKVKTVCTHSGVKTICVSR